MFRRTLLAFSYYDYENIKKTFDKQHALGRTFRRTDPISWLVLSGTAWTREVYGDIEQGSKRILTAKGIARSSDAAQSKATSASKVMESDPYYGSVSYSGNRSGNPIAMAAQSRHSLRRERLATLMSKYQLKEREDAKGQPPAASSLVHTQQELPRVIAGDLLLTHFLYNSAQAGVDEGVLGSFAVSIWIPKGNWALVGGMDFGAGLQYTNESQCKSLKDTLTSLISDRSIAAQKYHKDITENTSTNRSPPLPIVLIPANASRSAAYFFGDRMEKMTRTLWR